MKGNQPCSNAVRAIIPWLLLTCLFLTACNRSETSNREVLDKLEAIKSELGNKQPMPVRWAYASRREIDTAVFTLIRGKMDDFKKSEALSLENTEKVHQYEALQGQWMQKQMEATEKRMQAMRIRFSPHPLPPDSTPADPESEELSRKVAQARESVAAIIDRREKQEAQFREQYKIDRLIAECVKGRYELVVDSDRKVLYSTNNEVPDITEGVVGYLKEKAVQ